MQADRIVPRATGTHADTSAVATAALTPTQATVLEMWRQILWVPDAGLHDNFLDLGGHSLTAARCINRIRVLFDVDVPLDAFFIEPADVATVAELIDLALAARATT